MVSSLKRPFEFSNLIKKQTLISSFIVGGRKLEEKKQVRWNHKLFSKSLHGSVRRYSGPSCSHASDSASNNINTKIDADVENSFTLEENCLLLGGSNGNKIKLLVSVNHIVLFIVFAIFMLCDPFMTWGTLCPFIRYAPLLCRFVQLSSCPNF